MKFNKSTLIRLSKAALLLVVIGFFMPISCDRNGFQIAEHFSRQGQGQYLVMLMLIFVAAVLSIVLTVVFFNKPEKEPVALDWGLLLASVVGGVFTFTPLVNMKYGCKAGRM